MTNQKIPTFIINLDEKPRKRWQALISQYKKECLEAFFEMNKLFDQSTITKISKYIALWTIKCYSISNNVLYKQELQGIADILDMSLENAILFQLCYEMFSACTSVIIHLNGSPIHFRTMDWGMSFLKKLTIELDFRKNDKTIFKAISWAGYIGIFTAMMPGRYSISLNYRCCGGSIFSNIKKALGLSWPAGYLIRRVLEDNLDFKEVLNKLKRSPVISPCYIILGNCLGKSYIIVRDRDDCVSLKSENYLIQTNIDPNDLNPKNNILKSIERRELAKKIIKDNIKKWHDFEDISKSFLVSPIINEISIYYCLMLPKANLMVSSLL